MTKLLILSLLLGCGSAPRMPGQSRAETIVWDEVLGGSWIGPPEITWYPGPCFMIGTECHHWHYEIGERAGVAWEGSFSKSGFVNVLIRHHHWANWFDADAARGWTQEDTADMNRADSMLFSAGL